MFLPREPTNLATFIIAITLASVDGLLTMFSTILIRND